MCKMPTEAALTAIFQPHVICLTFYLDLFHLCQQYRPKIFM